MVYKMREIISNKIGFIRITSDDSIKGRIILRFNSEGIIDSEDLDFLSYHRKYELHIPTDWYTGLNREESDLLDLLGESPRPIIAGCDVNSYTKNRCNVYGRWDHLIHTEEDLIEFLDITMNIPINCREALESHIECWNDSISDV